VFSLCRVLGSVVGCKDLEIQGGEDAQDALPYLWRSFSAKEPYN